MKVVVLTGGVGGAKFVLGLQECGLGRGLTAIVNTGDDFRHLGLHVSPDVDTLLYTLSGQDNVAQGWGREGESWAFMEQLRRLGGPGWFQLGDGDLALHVLRSALLADRQTLSEVTATFAAAWNIAAAVLPMTDDPVATWIDSDEGPLAFQEYFVARRCAPAVREVRFDGAAAARPAAGVVAAIEEADAVFIAPSNPWLSVDPILAMPGIAAALKQSRAPVIAISPLVGGQAVKGPTTKLMAELGIPTDNAAIAMHYEGLIDGLLHDPADAPAPGLPCHAEPTLMRDRHDKLRVARAALEFARRIAGSI